MYEGESNENLKSAIKIRTIARFSCKFQHWYGLKSGRQVAVRYYIEKWSHCVPFVFRKLRVKTYLRFSCDSPSYASFGGRFSTRRPAFNSRALDVGFVTNEVALTQDFLKGPSFSTVTCHTYVPHSSVILNSHNSPICGLSTKGLSLITLSKTTKAISKYADSWYILTTHLHHQKDTVFNTTL